MDFFTTLFFHITVTKNKTYFKNRKNALGKMCIYDETAVDEHFLQHRFMVFLSPKALDAPLSEDGSSISTLFFLPIAYENSFLHHNLVTQQC